jgi:DNA-directed RNA polymerase subunit L
VPELFIRVQTNGDITPKEAVVQVIKKLMQMYNRLQQEFTREFELRRVVQAREKEQAREQGGR